MQWLRNGQALQGAANTVTGADHDLVIRQARLSDSGNYSCLASNVAARRRSSAAAVLVFGRAAAAAAFPLYLPTAR